jgi:hypothetical protein
MKKIWLSLAIALITTFPTPASADGDECWNTGELHAIGKGIEMGYMGRLVLTGYIVNNSHLLGYEDVLVKANIYNEDMQFTGTHEFRMDEDVELGETEDFRVHLRPGQNISYTNIGYISYTVVCAEID